MNNVKININDKELKELIEVCKKAKNNPYKAKVGVLQGSEEINGTTVAGYGFFNEVGSVVNNLPKRSFIKEPLEAHLTEKVLEKANTFKKLIFEEKDLYKATERLGLIGKTICLNSFKTSNDGKWEDNAPITREGGVMKNKVSGKLFKVKGKGGKAVMTNTGRLKKSIESEVVSNV